MRLKASKPIVRATKCYAGHFPIQKVYSADYTRFSRNLRKLLLDYISQNKDCLPIDFDVCLNDFNILWNFLDLLDDLQKK